MNGFLVNTGRAPLCEVRLGIDPHQQYLSIWPLWAQQGEWLDDFRPGQAVAVGFAAPDARADSAFPPLVLEDFDICGHPTGKPVGGMTRNAATGEISFPRALEATTVRMADAVGLPKLQRRTQATPAAVDPVSASKATPAGKCAVYQKGAATLAMCADSVVQWGKDTQQVNGFMVNLGKTQLCDVRLEVVADSNKVCMTHMRCSP